MTSKLELVKINQNKEKILYLKGRLKNSGGPLLHNFL